MITDEIKRLIRNAITEDIGPGDYTTKACVNENAVRAAQLIFKDTGIVAGVHLAKYIFQSFDPAIEFESSCQDGDYLTPDTLVFTIRGNARKILSAERLVLNCMQRMSGIATHTHELVEKIKDFNCKVLDTRKTTPGFRALEKWAVKIGGAENHRFGLFDVIMIKDNHIDYAGGIVNAIENVQQYLKEHQLNLPVIVEARNREEVRQILTFKGIQRILLDNFSPDEMSKAIEFIGDTCETEASGGITGKNILDYAKTGVNYISIGALTHQINSLDMSLKAMN